jgi:hypothetical protein
VTLRSCSRSSSGSVLFAWWCCLNARAGPQVVAAALDTDVRVVFVGPQVPERLAGMGAQYGRVAMRFVQVRMQSHPARETPGAAPATP